MDSKLLIRPDPLSNFYYIIEKEYKSCLLEEKFCDVTFVCNDGQQTQAHQCILGHLSKKFLSTIFQEYHYLGKVTIILPDIDVIVLMKTLLLTYKGQFNDIDGKTKECLNMLGIIFDYPNITVPDPPANSKSSFEMYEDRIRKRTKAEGKGDLCKKRKSENHFPHMIHEKIPKFVNSSGESTTPTQITSSKSSEAGQNNLPCYIKTVGDVGSKKIENRRKQKLIIRNDIVPSTSKDTEHSINEIKQENISISDKNLGENLDVSAEQLYTSEENLEIKNEELFRSEDPLEESVKTLDNKKKRAKKEYLVQDVNMIESNVNDERINTYKILFVTKKETIEHEISIVHKFNNNQLPSVKEVLGRSILLQFQKLNLNKIVTKISLELEKIWLNIGIIPMNLKNIKMNVHEVIKLFKYFKYYKEDKHKRHKSFKERSDKLFSYLEKSGFDIKTPDINRTKALEKEHGIKEQDAMNLYTDNIHGPRQLFAKETNLMEKMKIRKAQKEEKLAAQRKRESGKYDWQDCVTHFSESETEDQLDQ